jgi:hypothetical protein
MVLSPESVQRRNEILKEYREVILRMREIEGTIGALDTPGSREWRELEAERRRLMARADELEDDYADWIPWVPLSRCPFCGDLLARAFDPVGLDGLWWMDRTARPYAEPEACPHFRLLLGAVNLDGLPPKGGLFEARPGPGVPYVIPRILSMPTMVAVVSSLPMHCGYTAYPVAYFSEEPPPPGSLTQSWARTEYVFVDVDGSTKWDIVEDPWDFDLMPWLEQGKLKWCEGEGEALRIAEAPPETCPFLQASGTRLAQIIWDDEIDHEFPPEAP